MLLTKMIKFNQGCQSRVWLHAEYNEEKVYSADSEAIITKELLLYLLEY